MPHCNWNCHLKKKQAKETICPLQSLRKKLERKHTWRELVRYKNCKLHCKTKYGKCMILYIVCLKFILKSCFSHTLLNMYVSCSTKCGEHTWQSLICYIVKHVWTVESFFASNRSHTELAKSNTEEEQCINQEETGEEQRKQKKSLNSPENLAARSHMVALWKGGNVLLFLLGI